MSDWLEPAEEMFARLSVSLLPREQYHLLQAALEELERHGRHPRVSRKKALKFIECSFDAFKHAQGVFHHALLANVLEQARRYAVTLGDKRSTAILDLQLGTVLLLINQPEASREACARGLAALDALGDRDFAEYAARFLIVNYFLRGEPLKVLDAYETIRTSLHADADPFVLTHVIPIVALNAAFLGQFRLGKRLFMSGLRNARTHGYHAARKGLEAHLGWILVAAGDLEQARLYIAAAIDDSEELHVPISRFWAERSQAYLLYAEGDLPGSYERMRMAKINGDMSGLYSGFYSAPWMLEMLWAFYRAGYPSIPGFEYQKEISRILNNTTNLHLQGVAYRLLALDARAEHASVDEQLELLQKSEELLLRASGNIELAKTWLQEAEIHLGEGQVEMAKPIIAKAWQVYARSAPNLFPQSFHDLLEPAADLPKEESIWPKFDSFMDLLARLPVPLARCDLHSRIVSIVCSFFGAEQGGLFTWGGETGRFELESGFNISNFHANEKHERFVFDFMNQASNGGGSILGSVHRESDETATALCIPLSTAGPKRALYLEAIGMMDISHELSPQQILQLSNHVGRQFSLLIDLLEATENAYRQNMGQATMIRGMPDNRLLFLCDAMDRTMHLANLAAQSDVSVIILGETGVGKELLALHIHRQSKRYHMPFVTVDLSCLSESLLESELFGHEKGAFTGASEQKAGQIELADKGTLFIDEIGDIPLSVQLKLLRVLQEKTYRRVGGTKVLHSDFRLIVATNKDLLSEAREGRFREDLYYRLNVISLLIPPLRERGDDIIQLSEHFLSYFSRKHGKSAPTLTENHKRCLKAYYWPGNVRELKNLMELVIVLQDDSLLCLTPQNQLFPFTVPPPLNSEAMPNLDHVQGAYIEDVLRHTEGRIAGKKGAAKILGLKPSTLYNRMKKLGMGDKGSILTRQKNKDR